MLCKMGLLMGGHSSPGAGESSSSDSEICEGGMLL